MAMLVVVFLTACGEQTVVVNTLAGSGEQGFADGEGSAARFNEPRGIAIDAEGNLYVADTDNHRIRKVTPQGEVSTLAGSGPTGRDAGGFADGEGHNAQFRVPFGIAIDRVGNLYVVDTYNHRIRKVTPQGEVSTLAGGEKGFADGKGSTARFRFPNSIVIDAAGNLYVTDTANNRIRKVTPQGEVSTLAGGRQGFADGQGHNAQFSSPRGIAIDRVDNLYVVDFRNSCIRKVTPEGAVSALTRCSEFIKPGRFGSVVDLLTFNWNWLDFGNDARFDLPSGIAIDAAGNLYVAEMFKHRIRKMTPEGKVSTLAGGRRGFTDGKGGAAQFNEPFGIAIDAQFSEPFGIAIDAAGNLYVTEVFNHSIRKIVIERP